ncbi:xanthine dehydrogenase YagT iron-sulfur-binding subunit [Comamonas sp. BIGb0124]|nr:xanthine dehydrogenase YagT iron-sulfur-binding subunit [Comamonas sp. BIGb0124]
MRQRIGQSRHSSQTYWRVSLSFCRHRRVRAGATVGTMHSLNRQNHGEKRMKTHVLSLNVNGEARTLTPLPTATLLDVLRDELRLTGVKKGCDLGACGACTVLADGRRIKACLALAHSYDGRAITTIEGLASDGVLHPLQDAFIRHDALQCGYCTPGQILSAVALLEEGVDSREAIREGLSGNLCRCGAQPNIVAAVAEVAGL